MPSTITKDSSSDRTSSNATDTSGSNATDSSGSEITKMDSYSWNPLDDDKTTICDERILNNQVRIERTRRV